jgi:hypothetical protein
MKPQMLDGDTPADKALWYTYLYWARDAAYRALKQAPALDPDVITDDPNRRVDGETAAALQSIIFAAFTLEYRLKRVLRVLQVSYPPKETLGPFLKQFWPRLGSATRFDGGGTCAAPQEWAALERDLNRLVAVRNDLAHANYHDALQFLSESNPSPAAEAARLFNSVVEAIKLINIATGYDTRGRAEIDTYFRPLKV